MHVPTWIIFIAWIIPSLFTGVLNKELLLYLSNPLYVTLLHLLVGSVFDYLVLSALHFKQHNAFYPISREKFDICRIGGLFFALNSSLTHVSYKYIPISLATTIKTTSPIFTVFLTFLLQNQVKTSHISSNQFISLCIIVFGVCISTLSEIEFDLFGFIAAIAATISSALYQMYSKIALDRKQSRIKNKNTNKKNKNKEKEIKEFELQPMELHLYNNILSFVFLGSVCVLTVVFWNETESNERDEKETQIAEKSIELILFQAMSACFLLWLEFNMALLVLGRISNVVHQILCTLQRLIAIIVSIFYFNRQVTFMNKCGIALAFCGFAIFQQIGEYERKKVNDLNKQKKKKN